VMRILTALLVPVHELIEDVLRELTC